MKELFSTIKTDICDHFSENGILKGFAYAGTALCSSVTSVEVYRLLSTNPDLLPVLAGVSVYFGGIGAAYGLREATRLREGESFSFKQAGIQSFANGVYGLALPFTVYPMFAGVIGFALGSAIGLPVQTAGNIIGKMQLKSKIQTPSPV